MEAPRRMEEPQVKKRGIYVIFSGFLALAGTAGLIYWLAGSAGGEAKPDFVEKMKRMAYYNQALGVQCDYCHIVTEKGEQKFELETPRKKTAKWMQETLVDGLRTREGKPIDCRTCHEGRARFLPSSQ